MIKAVTLFATTLLFFALQLASPWALADCSKGDFNLPKQVQLQGYQQPAVLNGYGARTRLFWDVYIAALYTPQPSHDPQAILAMPGPKRISIYFSHDVPADKLIEGWRDGFEKNNNPQQLTQLQHRLQQSYGYFHDMHAGDVINIDNNPKDGSRLWINGKLIHTIPGQDYFNAVLKIWLGQEPPQAPLKDCMLGISLEPTLVSQ